MLHRILTIRKHKTLTFCDSYSFEDYRKQLAFQNDLLTSEKLAVGDVVDLTGSWGVNKRGERVYFVEKIDSIIHAESATSYKGFQIKNESESISPLAQDLNGGIKLRQYQFKLLFLQNLEALMQSYGFFRTYTPITTPYRGTSRAQPVAATGQFVGKRYIKITHELELKKQCYLSLAPLYEIGYVMRDRYSTQNSFNEYLTLEAVAPLGFLINIADVYQDIYKIARELVKELSLDFTPQFHQMPILNLAEVQGADASNHSIFETCERIASNYNHCVIYNSPIKTPLGFAETDGIVRETKWFLNGRGLGHGYKDEYRASVLREYFTEQQSILSSYGIPAELPADFLQVCAYAGVPTFSFNFGIDRFLRYFFGE